MALSTSLISYWSLADVNDAHGSNHLTNNNTATFVTGKVGNAVNLVAASDQFLSIASNASLQTGDIDFTLACWVNATSYAVNRGILGKATSFTASAIEYALEYVTSGTQFRFVVSDGSATKVINATNFGMPSAATWYFIVAWHDSVANTTNICVNDGTPNSVAHTTGVATNSALFQIGRSITDTNRDWQGTIDEAGFWKRVLSAAEITELYNGGSGRDYAYISAGAATKAFPFMARPTRIWEKRRQ